MPPYHPFCSPSAPAAVASAVSATPDLQAPHPPRACMRGRTCAGRLNSLTCTMGYPSTSVISTAWRLWSMACSMGRGTVGIDRRAAAALRLIFQVIAAHAHLPMLIWSSCCSSGCSFLSTPPLLAPSPTWGTGKPLSPSARMNANSLCAASLRLCVCHGELGMI